MSGRRLEETDRSLPEIALRILCIPATVGTLNPCRGKARYIGECLDFPLYRDIFFEPDLDVLTDMPELFLAIRAACWNDTNLEVYSLGVVKSTT
jgi:hypothetical protein